MSKVKLVRNAEKLIARDTSYNKQLTIPPNAALYDPKTGVVYIIRGSIGDRYANFYLTPLEGNKSEKTAAIGRMLGGIANAVSAGVFDVVEGMIFDKSTEWIVENIFTQRTIVSWVYYNPETQTTLFEKPIII